MSNQGSNLREFGEFRLFVQERLLWFSETPVKLPEKALDVLLELTAAGGKVVTREHLTSTIWPGESGAENGLAQAIHTLRKVFRSHGSPDLIVTVPRRGYRFVGVIDETAKTIPADLSPATVEIPAQAMAGTIEAEAVNRESSEITALSSAPPASPVSRMRSVALAAAGLAVILVAGIGLWRYGAAEERLGLGSPRSIAVLPIKGGNGVDADLRLRITDSLITRLSEVKQIRVRPISVVNRYLDSDDDPLTIGKQLDVDLIFDGSVVQTDEVLRVELRARSTNTGLEVWQDRFFGERGRLLLLQDTISDAILKALQIGGADPAASDLSSKLTKIPDAYEHYLKGRYFARLRTAGDIRNAITHFSRATELDPAFASAFIGLGEAHFLLYDYNYDPSHENIRIANENIDIAVKLDPNNDKAFVLMGHIKTRYEWDWAGAERSFEEAFRIRPDSADAFHRRGMMFLKLREFEKAEADIRRALELEPSSIAINMNLGTVLFFSGDYEAALIQFRKAIELEENLFAPRWYIARCLWQMGNTNAAFRAYYDALRSTGGQELASKVEATLNASGTNEALRVWIGEWKRAGVSDHSLAILSAHKKDKAATLDYLKKVVSSRHPWASSIYAEPEFAFLTDEPEFQELIEKLGVRKR